MELCKNNRLLLLLWFVGYCGEFPVKLASRLDGHADWNRHVMYRAIRDGYVTVYRGIYRQRVIRSLQITDKGIDYIAEHDSVAIGYILAKCDSIPASHHSMVDKIIRLHAIATGLVMSYCCGAEILPDKKPTLFHPSTHPGGIPFEPSKLYYYSPQEVREAIQNYDEDTASKTSRFVGIIVQDHHCYILYYTGFSRMYWKRGNEENTVAAIETLLAARGMNCSIFSQIVIGTQMGIAVKIARAPPKYNSRYFTLSDRYDHCYYLENTQNGDRLLNLITHPKLRIRQNNAALIGYLPPDVDNRSYDALTPERNRPVILGYDCDLLQLTEIDPAMDGFRYGPIVLCFDYQVDAVQSIVGSLVEVRTVEEVAKEKGANPPQS